jgi:hypothetical protein
MPDMAVRFLNPVVPYSSNMFVCTHSLARGSSRQRNETDSFHHRAPRYHVYGMHSVHVAHKVSVRPMNVASSSLDGSNVAKSTTSPDLLAKPQIFLPALPTIAPRCTQYFGLAPLPFMG